MSVSPRRLDYVLTINHTHMVNLTKAEKYCRFDVFIFFTPVKIRLNFVYTHENQVYLHGKSFSQKREIPFMAEYGSM